MGPALTAFTVPSNGYPEINGRRVDDSPSDQFALYNRQLPLPDAADDAPTHHRPGSRRMFGRIAGWSGGCSAALAGPYIMLAQDEDSHRLGRNLLFLGICVLTTLCGVAVMNLIRARADDRRDEALQSAIGVEIQAAKSSLKRHIHQAKEEGVSEVRGLDLGAVLGILQAMARTLDGNQAILGRLSEIADLPELLNDRTLKQGKVLHQELSAIKTLLDLHGTGAAVDLGDLRQMLKQVQDTVDGRLAELERRVGHGEAYAELLRGLTAWAMDMDHRLAEVQRTVAPVGASVAASSNGHHEIGSPLELSDEALRGYFLGFYDRERGDGAAPTTA